MRACVLACVCVCVCNPVHVFHLCTNVRQFAPSSDSSAVHVTFKGSFICLDTRG